MICQRDGFVIQRHNELRDLESEILRMVCGGVEIEPVLQDITGEELNRGANTAPDARLDIVARGFWERDRSPFFDVRICHPNTDSYGNMDLNQIYRQHASRILEVEQATFTRLPSPGSVSSVTLAVVELIYCFNKLLDSLTFRIHRNSARVLL